MDFSHLDSPLQVISCSDNQEFQSEGSEMMRAGYVLVSAGVIQKLPGEKDSELLRWWGVFVKKNAM